MIAAGRTGRGSLPGSRRPPSFPDPTGCIGLWPVVPCSASRNATWRSCTVASIAGPSPCSSASVRSRSIARRALTRSWSRNAFSASSRSRTAVISAGRTRAGPLAASDAIAALGSSDCRPRSISGTLGPPRLPPETRFTGPFVADSTRFISSKASV